MTYATLNEEKKLWKRGYRNVVCIDEAGRGPLAGPVVAAAVAIQHPITNIQHPIKFLKFKFSKNVSDFKHSNLIGDWLLKIENFKLRDSKKLLAKQREIFYKAFTLNPTFEWGVGIVSEKVIDKINILEATKLAMKKAVDNLSKKSLYHKSYDRRKCGIADFLILDGNMKLNLPTCGERSRTIPQKSIVKGDEKVFSCAAASIIAKVTRDRIMIRYHKKYPLYHFDLHKGYGTRLHLQMLKKYGPCRIHRQSFCPVFSAKRKA